MASIRLTTSSRWRDETSSISSESLSSMPLLRTRVIVRINGIPRSILLVEEGRDGSLYLKLRTGTQIRSPPNAVRVVQERYSIHTTLKSPDYTMLKSRVGIENGLERTTVALTDAVKRKNGFSYLFVMRASDMQADIHDFVDSGGPIIEIGDFNPSEFTMIFGAFVGHSTSEFAIPQGALNVTEIVSGQFKVVLCAASWNIPALPCALKMDMMTYPPGFFGESEETVASSQMMAGKSAESCVRFFNGISRDLLVDLLETYLTHAPDDDARAIIHAHMDSVLHYPP